MIRTQQTQPIIFIPDQQNNPLIDVQLERHKHFDIYWFHWLRDGFFNIEDFEPIILIYGKDGNICSVVVRRHWSYIPYDVDEIASPLQALFSGSFHEPHIKTTVGKDEFDEKCKKLISENYSTVEIQDNKIHENFRIGKGHPSKVFGTVEDPSIVAERIHLAYCS